jgi:hypothetical protein
MSSPDVLTPAPDEIERFLLEQKEAWRARLEPGASAHTPLAIATSQRLVANLARSLREPASPATPPPDVYDRKRADALLLEGDLPAARRLQEELASAAEGAFGYTDPRTLHLKTELVLTLYELTEFELARQLQVEILHDAMSLRDDDTHEDVLAAMFNLSRILLQINGEEHLAIGLRQHVFSTRLDTLGSTHAETVSAREALVEATAGRDPEGNPMADAKDFCDELLLPLLGWMPFGSPGGDHRH